MEIDTSYEALQKLWYDYSENEDPKLMESIGSLADKLATVNLKMGFNQEKLYFIRKQSTEEFENQWKNNMSELHTILKRCTDLNVQRSRLVDEIDRKLAAIIKGDINPDDLVNPQHKTY
jgi:hypothetical protein